MTLAQEWYAITRMPRKLRLQYPDAIYHLMNRGDRRENIFNDHQDRLRFLAALGQACEKTEGSGAFPRIARRAGDILASVWSIGAKETRSRWKSPGNCVAGQP